MTIGEKIKTLRKNQKLTQTDLGKKLNVKADAVSKWECGRVTNIPTSKLRILADLFDVDISYLVDDDSPVPPQASTSRNPFLSERAIEIDNHRKQLIAAQDAAKYRNPDASKVLERLFYFCHLGASQYEIDRAEHMVTICSVPLSEPICRVPEALLLEKDNPTSALLSILSCFPEETETSAQFKLLSLIPMLNKDGLSKTVSYILDLLENPKHQQTLRL